MRLANFTHANVEEAPGRLARVVGDLDMISFHYYSHAAKATILLAPGAALPVTESVETVTKLKEGTKHVPTRKQKRPA